MDKVLSVRVDQAVLQQLSRATQQAGLSKKNFVEDAIRHYARKVEKDDVWTRTAGSWQRDEPVADTVAEGRAAFNRSMSRHQPG